MTPAPARTLPELELLERAVSYARLACAGVPGTPRQAPTPCAGWDLGDLLGHMSASLRTLEQAAQVGGIALFDPPASRADDRSLGEQVRLISDQACALLESWTSTQAPPVFRIGGSELQAGLLASAGALEVTVHGWDVAASCSLGHRIPEALAEDLLSYVPLLVSEADRPHRFAPVVPTGSQDGPEAELLARLGRSAGWRPALGVEPGRGREQGDVSRRA